MEHNPDIKTREDAIKHLIAIREERALLSGEDDIWSFRSKVNNYNSKDNDEEPDTEDTNGRNRNAAAMRI